MRRWHAARNRAVVMATRVGHVVERALGRNAWVLVVATIVAGAYLQARAAGLWIARALRVPEVTAAAYAPAPAAESPAPAPASHRARDVQRILARNVFDADAGCLNCAGPASGAAGDPPAPGGVQVRNGAPLEPCRGALRVVAAIDSGDPLSSFALLAPANGAALAYRAGQRVDGGMVAAIGWHALYGATVVVERVTPQSRTRCFYAQVMPPRAATTPEVAGPGGATPRSDPASSAEQALADGIQRNGEREYTVQRRALMSALENQGSLMTMAQVMPFQQDGRLAGLQLARVRAGSLLTRLGIQAGDVLTRIDGLEMNAPDRWLEAYTRLMRAEHATVTLLRGGRPMNLDVTIR